MGFFNWNGPAIVIQLIGGILMSVAIFLPYWLANPPGLNYYPFSRSWGLIWVVGRLTRTHWQTWNVACSAASQMSMGFACVSPLCHWYSGKCGGFRIILVVSSVVCAILCLSTFLLFGSLLCSCRKSTQALRFSSGFAFLSGFLALAGILAYVFGMGQGFQMANNGGHYPVPQPGASFIIACVATFFFFVGAILHCARFRTLKREVDYIQDMKYAQQEAKADLGIGPY